MVWGTSAWEPSEGCPANTSFQHRTIFPTPKLAINKSEFLRQALWGPQLQKAVLKSHTNFSIHKMFSIYKWINLFKGTTKSPRVDLIHFYLTRRTVTTRETHTINKHNSTSKSKSLTKKVKGNWGTIWCLNIVRKEETGGRKYEWFYKAFNFLSNDVWLLLIKVSDLCGKDWLENLWLPRNIDFSCSTYN